MRSLFAAMAFIAITTANLFSAETDELLATLKAVGKKGAGNAEAVAALLQLKTASPEALPQILAAFEGSNLLVENYLRGAFEAIADRAIRNEQPLPQEQMEAFVKDTTQPSRARRLAYEWLIKVDDTLADRIIPDMLLDPNPGFRRDAVERLIAQAEAQQEEKQPEKAVELYQTALKGATDADLVEQIVKPLRELGKEVDLQQHFGFLTTWSMIGPFDNREKKGFDTAYPPESEIDLEAKYDGKEGKVAWGPLGTTDEYGIIDIAKAIAPYKGAVMYATTEFTATQEQSAEFRIGTPNAWKLWLNGKLLFEREEYHRGMKMDQYRVECQLKPGKNRILLKICQNEQDQSWAQRYQFQIRVCDPAGIALNSAASNKTSSLEIKQPAAVAAKGGN